MKRSKHIAVSTLFYMTSALFSTSALFGDDHKIRRVMVISIDGMHALDMALWVKNNPNSALAKLSAQGVNYTNASTTKPGGLDSSHCGYLHGRVSGYWRHVLRRCVQPRLVRPNERDL